MDLKGLHDVRQLAISSEKDSNQHWRLLGGVDRCLLWSLRLRSLIRLVTAQAVTASRCHRAPSWHLSGRHSQMLALGWSI